MKRSDQKNKLIRPDAGVAILAMSALPYLTGAISGSLADIAASFPDAPISLVKMVYSLCSLTSVACGAVTSFLLVRISIKYIALLYLLFTFLGGILSFVLSGNLLCLLFLALLQGFCGGLIPVGAVAITMGIDSEERQKSLLGKQYAACCLGGMVIMLLATMLARTQWKNAYLIYLLVIPVFLIALVGLPASPPEKPGEKGGGGKGKYRLFTVDFVICCAMSMLFYSANCVYSLNVSFILQEIGGIGGKLGSIPNIVMCAGGLVAGIRYDAYYRRFGRDVFFFGTAVLALGFGLVAFFPSVYTVFLCAFCDGFAMSAVLPFASFWASKTVHASRSGSAIAIVNMFINLGSLSTPFLYPAGTEAGGLGQRRPFFLALAASVLLLVLWGGLLRKRIKE